MNLPKTYDPKAYESDIYALWEKEQAFTPKPGAKDHFSIVIPPPNANGNLHLGHALTLGIEDIMVRYHRMKGESALLLPGADHAGFETQVVYEKKLAADGKSRFEFTREELYTQIWDFVAENRDNYEGQFRRLGAGLDWSRFTYTLDEKIVSRAYATFKKMWDEKLIYRGERLVNFCTHHGTGFADIEVEYKEQSGHLWHIRYPLTDGSGEVVVATTRPETMLGDTAVAVHPKDERFTNMIGKTVKLPLTHREIPIIADEFVDREFGSGAVKITPAHDTNDFEAGKRHDLPFVSVISPDGTMSHDTVHSEFAGMPVDEARKAIVERLKNDGCLVKTDDHFHSVGHCYKCGTVLQPLLRDQWFIDMQPLTKRAIEALEAKEITFHPESKRKVLVHYLENLRDWNISRQIAWGIPIPAFENVDQPGDWIYDERVTEEFITVDGRTYRRDPDVFDTWFSSSSWPYATLDYPDGKDFKEFYPLSVMETGVDILFPWVSRMIMFGLYVTDQVPFKEVYLHGLVLDGKGAKMSKSKGNVIDPMDKIDEYGADALRMGLIAGVSAGQNQPFSDAKMLSARNFCNKLWNIARFIEAKEPSGFKDQEPSPETPADYWVLDRLNTGGKVIGQLLDKNRFSEAYEALYHLVWDDVADWYVESSKFTPNASVLGYTLATILKLAHPFAPFVTETIWQTMHESEETILALQLWPTAVKSDKKQAETFESLRAIIREIRFIKTSLQVTAPHLYFQDSNLLQENEKFLTQMAGLRGVKEVADGYGLHLTIPGLNAWLDIDQETTKSFVDQLQAREVEQKNVIKNLTQRLNNPAYVKKAPKVLVEQTKEQLTEAEAQLETLQRQITRFS